MIECASPERGNTMLADDIADRERLIVALDLPDTASARQMVERLGDTVGF